MAIFGARDVSGASFFDGIYDVFCTCLNFYIKKCNIKNYQKITQKSISSWSLAFCWFHPLPQTSPSQGPFLTVFAMFYAHRALFKNKPFLCLGGGSAARSAPPIAKAKATPHAMRFNMPGIRCLVHRRIIFGGKKQPPPPQGETPTGVFRGTWNQDHVHSPVNSTSLPVESTCRDR